MLWNFASAGLLLWLSRRYKEDVKPGTIFAGWLVLAGIGRVIIEFFRPDQPKIAGLGITYSSIFAALMAVVGILLLMARYRAINLKFAENWAEEYKRSSPGDPLNGSADQSGEQLEPEEEVDGDETPTASKAPSPEEEAEAARIRMEKLIGRKTIGAKEPTPPAKKSS
jgi:hypothetical protein